MNLAVASTETAYLSSSMSVSGMIDWLDYRQVRGTRRQPGKTVFMSPSDDAICMAERRYRSGDYAGAAEIVRPLTQLSGASPSALRILGLCCLRQGDPEAALRNLSDASALAPQDPWVRLHFGIVLQALNRHPEAAALFRLCQPQLPRDPAPLLNLASSLLVMGDPRAALRAARKARTRAPQMAETQYMAGVAQLACREWEQADASFCAAIARAPRFTDAWVNLGVTRYRLGAIASALAALRQAVAIDPLHRAGVASLAAMLRLTGEGEIAETLVRELLERDPGAAAARLNLAVAWLDQDRDAEVLDLLASPAPDDATTRVPWLLQRSLALIKLRHVVEARVTMDNIGEVSGALTPAMAWRRLLLAEAVDDGPGARQEALRMQAALGTDAPILPEHRIGGHYDLARFWSKHGDHERAFAGWAAGHRLLSAFQPFSRRDFAAFVDATIAHFDRRRLTEGARAANGDATPVFVVGMPRSGTTLVEQILAAHRDVFGAGERIALAQAFHRLGGGTETPAAAARVAASESAVLEAESGRYLDTLHTLAPGAACIVDKMPGNFRHLGLVALMLPGARIIQCERDPRDIGLSIFTYRFYGSHGYAHDLADLGWYIGQQQRLMRHWQTTLPTPPLRVALADWVTDFPATLARVLAYLDLPDDPACARFHTFDRRVHTVSRAQVRQPINARGLGRWKIYERHLGPLLEALRESGVLPESGDAS